MKRRRIILLLVVLALALAPIALAQARDSTPASTGGGGYHLTSAGVQASSSGGYHLLGPAAPDLTGNGCCCTYLPCVNR